MIGKVTDIETMGLVDGPGMRLVLFLSGCRLRCLYCHNPETWDKKGYTKKLSSTDVLKLYKKYENYYGKNGGVTFSGGECLLQSKFVASTSKLLKKHGIHIALDTSGVGENYEESVRLADLIILDVKATTEEEYKNITGQTMEQFNKFLNYVISLNKKLWLRQVIVPGINDDKAHIKSLADFASKIPNVERVELLPYHTMGVSKYSELNIPYRLNGVPSMDKEKCKELEKLLKKA